MRLCLRAATAARKEAFRRARIGRRVALRHSLRTARREIGLREPLKVLGDARRQLHQMCELHAQNGRGGAIWGAAGAAGWRGTLAVYATGALARRTAHARARACTLRSRSPTIEMSKRFSTAREAHDASASLRSVSYTHLTLPTTPYV